MTTMLNVRCVSRSGREPIADVDSAEAVEPVVRDGPTGR